MSLHSLYSTDRLWTALITNTEKQLTPLAIYVEIHITNQRKNVLLIPVIKTNCPDSSDRNKAKRFHIYVRCYLQHDKGKKFLAKDELCELLFIYS